MADTIETQAEPQRPAQPHPHVQPPQPAVLEKTPLHNQQPMQFIPYVPAQQAPGLAQPPSEGGDKPPVSRNWHIAKTVLGSAALIAAAVIWALCIVMLVRNAHSGFNYEDSFNVLLEATYAMALSGFAIIWLVSEFVTAWTSKTKSGIHPGAHVGMHLLIWLAAVPLLVFISAFVSNHVEQLEDIRSGGNSDWYYSWNRQSWDDYDAGAFALMLHLEEALDAFVALLLIIHFVLFVRACVETDRYNKSNVKTRVVYVHVPMPPATGPGQQLMGYYAYQPLPGQPLPFPQQQQQPQAQVPGGVPPPPQQAHLHGYYCPVPAPVAQARGPERDQQPSVPGPSTVPRSSTVPAEIRATDPSNEPGSEQGRS